MRWVTARPGGRAHPQGVSTTIVPERPRFPDPIDPRRYQPVRDGLTRDPDTFNIVMWRGPFEVAGFIRSLDGLMIDLAAAPARAERLLRAAAEFQAALIDEVAPMGVDAVMIGDDYGRQRGLMVSPEMWRRLIAPSLKMLVERVLAHDLPFVLHSDGDVSAIVPDLIEMGVAVLNPVQPECCDVFALKRQYGRDICLYGATPTQSLLVHGTPGQVRARLRETVHVMSQGGGYIFAPSFTIIEGTPVENAMAFIEVIEELLTWRDVP